MNNLLHHDKENINAILAEALAVAGRHFRAQGSVAPGMFVDGLPLEDLPNSGTGAISVLREFEMSIGPRIANSSGPRYFGFVTGGSTPASVVGDWMVGTFDANAFGSHDSIAPQIEHQALHFLKQLLGLDPDYFGSFVTGATMSNFVGLALGRQWVGESLGVDIANDGLSTVDVKVVSATPHASVIKSMAMLGMGRKALLKVPTLPNREAVDIKKLEAVLQEVSRPVVVVANAGTVNTVDFDDLKEIAALKDRYPFWLHVDAAFGGFAAASPAFAHLVAGINAADSVTVDAHKWLNVPYDAAMQFTRHKALQLKVFQNSAAYLGDPQSSPDFFHYTPENSRRWRALPAWFSLKAYGREGYREIVERNCRCAHRLGEWISLSADFELLAPVKMNVVCFGLKDQRRNVQAFLDQVRDDGRVFFTPTVYQGRPAIRAAVSNWQTTMDDIDIAIDVLGTMVAEQKAAASPA